MLEVIESDLAIIDKECVNFIKAHGSPLQKKKLKTYKN